MNELHFRKQLLKHWSCMIQLFYVIIDERVSAASSEVKYCPGVLQEFNRVGLHSESKEKKDIFKQSEFSRPANHSSGRSKHFKLQVMFSTTNGSISRFLFFLTVFSDTPKNTFLLGKYFAAVFVSNGNLPLGLSWPFFEERRPIHNVGQVKKIKTRRKIIEKVNNKETPL